MLRWGGWAYHPGALVLVGAVVLLMGCARATPGASPPSPQTSTATPTPAPLPTATGTPSPTPEPLAARVNGEGILLAEWLAEVRRAQAAATDLGQELPPAQAGPLALDMLIERLLLAQAARERGLFPEEDEVQTRLDALQQAQGGPEAFQAYLTHLGYTFETFRQALALDMAAARMRDALADEVPNRGPQVRARIIQVPTRGEAEAVLQYLQAGNEFRALVRQYHPGGQGDLGWFPRGVLWLPEVEEAAFALEPGEYSDVIATDRGFFVVFVEDRSDDRPYAPWALQVLRARAVETYLAQARQQAQVEVLVDPQAPPLPAP